MLARVHIGQSLCKSLCRLAAAKVKIESVVGDSCNLDLLKAGPLEHRRLSAAHDDKSGAGVHRSL